jgi:hypothetical protein
MTLQDFEDYAEASALHDAITTHELAKQAEADRIFKGSLDTNTRKG